MAQAALKAAPADTQPSRRFQIPDLDTHGRWIIERLLKVYPHQTERNLIGFLRGIIADNGYLFLYQDCGVALATVAKTNPLLPKSHVEEIFVWVAPGHQPDEGAVFYEDFSRWTKHHGLDLLIVEVASDVPHETIRTVLDKRLFERKVTFARV